MTKKIFSVILGATAIWGLTVILSAPILAAAIIANHESIEDFEFIPEEYLTQIRNDYSFYYGHTSHGSQVITGLGMLYSENSDYLRPSFHEVADDLGTLGDTTWVAGTRNYLNTHSEINAVMWSWCGGVSTNNTAGINVYLNKIDELEEDYPDVIFIYMTGHLDGTGTDGNLYAMNNLIRQYCSANDKILFDFADIESYNPDGTFYPDASDACEWCSTWCGSHTCPSCASCAHSHCFNCYLKGKAWWWMMAKVAGWDLVLDADDDNPSVLPEDYSLGQNHPNPFNPVTTFTFSLPTASDISLEIYNIIGQKIDVAAEGRYAAGEYNVSWDAGNLPSGVYFYRLLADDFKETRKMILLK